MRPKPLLHPTAAPRPAALQTLPRPLALARLAYLADRALTASGARLAAIVDGERGVWAEALGELSASARRRVCDALAAEGIRARWRGPALSLAGDVPDGPALPCLPLLMTPRGVVWLPLGAPLLIFGDAARTVAAMLGALEVMVGCIDITVDDPNGVLEAAGVREEPGALERARVACVRQEWEARIDRRNAAGAHARSRLLIVVRPDARAWRDITVILRAPRPPALLIVCGEGQVDASASVLVRQAVVLDLGGVVLPPGLRPPDTAPARAGEAVGWRGERRWRGRPLAGGRGDGTA